MTIITPYQNFISQTAIYASQSAYCTELFALDNTLTNADTDTPNENSKNESANENEQSKTENMIHDENNEIWDIVPPSVDKAVSLALNYDCVIGARAFNYKNKIVIALLTIPFYLKSERDGTRWLIQNELSSSLCYEDIIVTFDVEVYRKIKSGLDEEQMKYLFTLAKAR